MSFISDIIPPIEVDCGTGIRNASSYAEKCLYVQNNTDCLSSGVFQYSFFIYCLVPENIQWLAMILLMLLLALLFLGLSTAADSFFCPSLAVIVDHLSLSHNIAGVTFLAFGNGAPDIFAALAAVLNSDNSSAGMAFGALLGAGMFLSTIIVGIVTLAQPFNVMQRPLLRDLTFYLATIYWTFYILYTGRVRLIDALGFLVLYVVYVVVVAAGRYVRKRMQARAKAEAQRRHGTPMDGQDFMKTEPPSRDDVSASDDETTKYDLFFSNPHGRGLMPSDMNVSDDLFSVDSVSIAASDMGLTTSVTKVYNCFKEFGNSLYPIDAEEWKRARWYSRVFMVFKAPILFTLTLTVPVVDSEKPNNNWSYALTLIQCCISPLFALAALQYFTYYIAGIFPIAVVGLFVSIALGLAVGFTSRTGEPPKYHKFFAYVGFFMAVIWIYCLAREVVNILRTFGVVLNLSHEILGLTVLAWSNSLGDLISDITVATQGYPRMAISACFGGPLFNILVGVGLPFTIAILGSGQEIVVPKTPVAQVLCVFLASSIISSFIILPASRFRATRTYALYLIILYLTFITVAILTELKVIHSLW